MTSRTSIVGILLIASLALHACSASIPPASVHQKPVSAAARPEQLAPPPALHRFGTFAEDEEVQLFPLQGTPLLRVGARIYSLRAHEATRDPGLEKVLFDAAGKPWWTLLAGSHPGELYADRIVPGAAERDSRRLQIVRVSERGVVPLGPVTTEWAHTAKHIVPLPDGRALVTAVVNEEWSTEIIPTAPGDEKVLDPKRSYGAGLRRADGSVMLFSREEGSAPTNWGSLITWRPGARAATTTAAIGLEHHAADLFATEDGALYARHRHGGDIFAFEGAAWVKVDPAAVGAAAEARRRHIERARPDGSDRVTLTLEGRHLEVAASGFARDSEGGVWALADSGLGLFHDRAPERVVDLGTLRETVAAMPLNFPPAAPATPPAPGAPLVEVLDASRYLREGEGTLAIHPLVGRTFIRVDDQLLYIDGDTLKSEPTLQRGLGDRPEEWGQEVIGGIGGHFPEAAWLPITHLYDRGSTETLLRWGAAGWSVAFSSPSGGKADRVHPLAHGWSLLQGLQGGFAQSYGPNLYLSLLHRNVAREVHRGLSGLRDTDEIRAVATLPDGTLHVALADRVAGWSPDGTALPPAPLPAGTTPYGLVVRPSSEMYVLQHPAKVPPPEEGRSFSDELEAAEASARPPPSEQHILRHDGKVWSQEPLPAHATRIERLHLGPRGSLWLTLEESPDVLVRSSSGVWSTMRAPAHIDSLWTGPAGDVWAVAGAKLLHTKPLPGGFDLDAVLPPRGIEQWGRACGTVSVLLHDVPRTAPKAVSFTATIDLLRPTLQELADGAAYYEVTSGGKRSLVVRLEAPTSWSGAQIEARAAAIMKAAEANIPGAKPRLLCLRDLGQPTLPRGVQSIRFVGGKPAPKAVVK